jgi:hypothetical protein
LPVETEQRKKVYLRAQATVRRNTANQIKWDHKIFSIFDFNNIDLGYRVQPECPLCRGRYGTPEMSTLNFISSLTYKKAEQLDDKLDAVTVLKTIGNFKKSLFHNALAKIGMWLIKLY